jgi:hypothetical protein
LLHARIHVRISPEISVPRYSLTKSSRRNLVGSASFRVGRFERPSLAVLEQSWAPPVISLMAKNEECHPTARSGRTGGPVCRRVWPTRHGRRSGPWRTTRRDNDDPGSTTAASRLCRTNSTRRYVRSQQERQADAKDDPGPGCQAQDGCDDHCAAEMNLVESYASSHVSFFRLEGAVGR